MIRGNLRGPWRVKRCCLRTPHDQDTRTHRTRGVLILVRTLTFATDATEEQPRANRSWLLQSPHCGYHCHCTTEHANKYNSPLQAFCDSLSFHFEFSGYFYYFTLFIHMNNHISICPSFFISHPSLIQHTNIKQGMRPRSNRWIVLLLRTRMST